MTSGSSKARKDLHLSGSLGLCALISATIIVSFPNPLLLIPIIVLEALFVLSLSNERLGRYGALLLETQVFLLAFYFIALRFGQVFNVESPTTNMYMTIVLFVLAVQAVISVYLAFRERIIKGILLFLASSTALSVVLILIFVVNEAAPAFVETNPISFLTGEVWNPYYTPESRTSLTFVTYEKDYAFGLSGNSSNVYLCPYSNDSFAISVVNEGGSGNTVALEVRSSTGQISAELNRTSVSVAPYESEGVRLDLATSSNCSGVIEIAGRSANNGQTDTYRMDFTVADNGVQFLPDRITADSYGDVINFKVNLTLENPGTMDDGYVVKVEAPEHFTPFVSGTNWNYSSGTGKINLSAGSNASLILYPMLTSRIPGRYLLNVTATSISNPGISNLAQVTYSYGADGTLRSTNTSKPVSSDGSVQYAASFVAEEPMVRGLTISGLTEGWSCELAMGNRTLLDGNGATNVTFAEPGTYPLILTIKAADMSPGTNISLTLSQIDWGSTPTFGILPFLVGSFLTTVLALVIAIPLGLGTAVFLAEYCPRRLHAVLRPLHELLAGIPSVIYGLWGYLVLGPFMAGYIFTAFGGPASSSRSLLVGSFVLSIMIVPLVITLSEDSIRAVRRELKEASYGLAATRWQTLRHVVLPTARSGIITSIVLSTGRAIGETMAVLMIMGAVFSMPTSPFSGVGTMTSVIASQLPSLFTYDLARHALFAIALVLFAIVFAINVVIFRIQKGRRPSGKPAARWLRRKNGGKGTSRTSKNGARPWMAKAGGSGSSVARSDSRTTAIISPRHHNPNRGRAFQKSKERLIVALIVLGVVFITGILAFIVGDIVIRGGAAISWELLTQREVGIDGGGIANAIIGSLLLVGIAIGVALPLAVGSAIYVHEYSKGNNFALRAVLFASNTLASTPSIVFGAFGFLFFVLFLGFGFSLLSGALTLALMVLPLMLASSIEALKSVPDEYREASMALGASRWQTVRHVVLPTAFPMVSGGVIVSIGRAIGETAAVIMTAGYSVLIVSSLFSPTASMPNLIYKNYEFAAKYPSLGEKIYSAAFILIVLVLCLNFLARFISNRARSTRGH